MATPAKRVKGKSLPVSAHPAFPAVVALWFAALLGLGSLVLPVVLFERLVDLSGVSALVPAAAPPLGVTARLAIALAAGLGGAGVGIFLARRIAAAQGSEAAPPRRKFAAEDDSDVSSGDFAAKRPISAREELGSDSLDEPIAAGEADESAPEPMRIGTRRRALAVTDDSGPSEFLDHAPLPGGAINPAQFSAEDIAAAHEPAWDGLDLSEGDLAEEQIDEPLELADLAELEGEADGEDEFADEVPSISFAAQFEAPVSKFCAPPAAIEYDEDPAFMHNSYKPSAPVTYNPFAGRIAAVAETGEYADEGLADTVQHFAARTPGAPLAERPLRELGMAELVERFALALQAHNAAGEIASDETEVAEYVSAGPLVFRRAGTVAPVAAPEAVQAAAQPTLPKALQPFTPYDLGADGEEDEELHASFSLPSASRTEAAAPFAANAQPELEDDAEDGAAYSSLLSIKTGFASQDEFVRIEDEDAEEHYEPVVVFPGQDRSFAASEPASGEPARRPFDAPDGSAQRPATSPASADTERALREALEKLQKMSGNG